MYIFYLKKENHIIYIQINSLLLIIYTYEYKSKVILMTWTKVHYFFLLDVQPIPPPKKKKMT